jgi:AbrB family looped-hinge helix DNA binding protein
MLQMSKVTAKYQITLPIKIRKELGIVPGAEVDIVKKGNKYILVVDPIAEIRNKWRGKFKDQSTTMDYLEQVRGPII